MLPWLERPGTVELGTEISEKKSGSKISDCILRNVRRMGFGMRRRQVTFLYPMLEVTN